MGRESISDDLEFDQLKEKAYDIYSLQMDKLQIMAARPGDPWKEKLGAGWIHVLAFPSLTVARKKMRRL